MLDTSIPLLSLATTASACSSKRRRRTRRAAALLVRRDASDVVVERVLAHGGGTAVADRLQTGFETHLGKTYLDGQELAGGQWQRLAVERGMMPGTPLLLVLDEPTAALDSAVERAYEEYGRTARDGGAHVGSVTVLIPHRFSSVAWPT